MARWEFPVDVFAKQSFFLLKALLCTLFCLVQFTLQTLIYVWLLRVLDDSFKSSSIQIYQKFDNILFFLWIHL